MQVKYAIQGCECVLNYLFIQHRTKLPINFVALRVQDEENYRLLYLRGYGF